MKRIDMYLIRLMVAIISIHIFVFVAKAELRRKHILIKSLIVAVASDATPVAIWLLDEGTGTVAKDTS